MAPFLRPKTLIITRSMTKPSLQNQIEFVRGARHLVAKGSTDFITINAQHYDMLLAIEENLIAVDLLSKTLNVNALQAANPQPDKKTA